MIKLVAIDLDGTLFTPDQKVTPSVRAAIYRLADRGIQPAIVTGREQGGAKGAIDMLGLDMPYVCSAGALIRAGHSGEIISARTMKSHAEIETLIQIARRTGAGLIGDGLEKNVWFGDESMNNLMDPLTSIHAWQSQRTFNPERDFDHPLLKVTVVGNLDLLHQVAAELEAHCPSFHYVYAGMNYLDVTRHDVNKGTALEILAKHLGVNADETAAIGDQPIDLSMLQFSGLPVAMGNAPETLKAAARWIAPNNTEDGVAWVVDQILETNQPEIAPSQEKTA